MFGKTRSGLLIPSHMNETPTHRCNFPGCDWLGYSDREQVAHVKEHVREDEAEIMAATTPFGADIEGDDEYAEWMQRRFRQLAPEVGVKEALDPKRY